MVIMFATILIFAFDGYVTCHMQIVPVARITKFKQMAANFISFFVVSSFFKRTTGTLCNIFDSRRIVQSLVLGPRPPRQ